MKINFFKFIEGCKRLNRHIYKYLVYKFKQQRINLTFILDNLKNGNINNLQMSLIFGSFCIAFKLFCVDLQLFNDLFLLVSATDFVDGNSPVEHLSPKDIEVEKNSKPKAQASNCCEAFKIC